MLDLIGRDGNQIVGSRLPKILGFSDSYDFFVKKVRQARNTGLTRLEISMHACALQVYNPWQAKVRTNWHKAISRALSRIVDTVLCDEIVYKDVCRALKFTSLVSSISIVKVNLMVIGRYQSLDLKKIFREQHYHFIFDGELLA